MTEERKVKYRLLAGHHNIGKRRIGPGGVFAEYPEKVEFMRHRIEEVDPAEAAQKAAEDTRAVSYQAKHRGGGKWAVFNSDGVQINDELLSKEDAISLAESLMEQEGE